MGYLKVHVDDENREFVEQLLNKLGFEVTQESEPKEKATKKTAVSPTMLFGEWKDLDLDPQNHRKQLWERKS